MIAKLIFATGAFCSCFIAWDVLPVVWSMGPTGPLNAIFIGICIVGMIFQQIGKALE